jgi:hypothetical protein
MPDIAGYPSDTPRATHTTTDTVETPAEDPLLDRMVRLPDEDDFADVLSPEGDSGDIVGSEVSRSTTVSDASVAGT